MSEKPEINLCPTCGTRLSEGAVRCLVCGADLTKTENSKNGSDEFAISGSRIPQVTLSLPVAILLFAMFLAIGAVLVYVAGRSKPEVLIQPTETSTPTVTPTSTLTPTLAPPTPTDTPQPTPTPLTHKVQANDTCLEIAALYKISVQSIVTMNNLSASCVLSIGQELLIPQPTPTVTSLPSITPNPATQTSEACEKVSYKVQAGDTLGKISTNYNVSPEAIKSWNGLSSDVVFEGTTIEIPLCQQPATPGASPTPTAPPPYAAPSLLLPANGAGFTQSDNSISLQWASVGTLGQNEGYQIKVEDITDTKVEALIDIVSDTKFSIPSSYRPKDNVAHIFRWTVMTVRQTGSDKEGRPIYSSAGAVSEPRYFSWSSSGAAATKEP